MLLARFFVSLRRFLEKLHFIKMDNLPQDPYILVSSINMQLRDNIYDSLEALCDYFGKDIDEIKDYLKEYGFEFLEEQKQFR